MKDTSSFHSKLNDRRAALRNRILEEAHTKFMRHGIRRVTMDEIARDLRVSKKTLYQHFEDKESLVQGVTERIAGDLIPAMTEAVAGGRPVAERLAQYFELVSRLPRFVTTELIRDIEADYPHLWKQIDERRRAVFSLFGAMIEQGIVEGAIRPEIHPKVMTRVLYALLDRVFVPEVLGLGEFTTDDAVRTMLAIFRGGLLEPAKRAGRSRTR
jgi:AcrR family transcriptional regulator